MPSFAGFFEGLPQQQRTKKTARLNFVNKQQQQAIKVRRLEDQLNQARAVAAAEELKDRSTSNRVTAFMNPILTANSTSNIAGIVPTEHPLRPNVIGNAEDQEEVHAQSQPIHMGFPSSSRTPQPRDHMGQSRQQRRRNAASAMDVQSAGYQANQHMLNEGVRRLQFGPDEDEFQ